MSNTYNSFVVLVVPDNEAILATAKAASRALDPDIGGYFAFEQQATNGTNNYRYYGCPCTKQTADSIQYMQAVPAMLHGAIAQDYATRWPGEVPPTLAECQAFVAALQIRVDMTAEAMLEELGLTKVEPQ